MAFTIGQELEVTGLITRSFNARGVFISTLSRGNESFELISSELLGIGSAVRVSGVLGEHLGKIQLKSKSVVLLSEKDAELVFSEVKQKAESTITLSDVALLVPDEVISTLAPAVYDIARKLLTAKALNRFVLLRFHGDADGVSGALALTKICKMQAIQQNYAVYSVGDAMRDLQLLHHEFMPLVVLLDFGSSIECEEGLKLLRAAGVEVVVIDHHPPVHGFPPSIGVLLSPWMTAHKLEPSSQNPESRTQNPELKTQDSKPGPQDLSKYPAGYLAVEIARSAGVKDIEGLAVISCAGDKSSIMEITHANRDAALVLDYMASYPSFGNSLDFYSSVMGKQELFTSMLFQAKEKIDQIFETVQRTLKEKDVNGINVAVIDLERISKKHEFPSKGKIATRVFESINSDKPLVVLGYGDRSIIFRINEAAVAKGVAADKIIFELKVTMKDFVDSGGGHAKAAAVRIRDEFAKDVIEEIVKIIARIAK